MDEEEPDEIEEVTRLVPQTLPLEIVGGSRKILERIKTPEEVKLEKGRSISPIKTPTISTPEKRVLRKVKDQVLT